MSISFIIVLFNYINFPYKVAYLFLVDFTQDYRPAYDAI